MGINVKLRRTSVFLFAGMVLGISGCRPLEGTEKPAQRPNVVFFLVDDLGWADLACYGNRFHETPNIDRLASEGVRFTDAYAASAVCSPTRASIMTGKYPARLKITDWIPGVIFPQAKLSTPGIRYELPLEETTLAEALQANGYHTLHVGKWHLGEKEQYWPLQQGFIENIGGHSKGAPGSYFHPYAKVTPETDWSVKNLPPGGQEGDYLTDRLTNEALELLDQYHQSEDPFFLYMSYYTVHTPLEAKPDYIQKYEQKKGQMVLQRENTTYASMIQSLDESVGRILNKLEELEVADNTLVIFFSDNGGLVEYDGNAPLREGKGFYYEGGIREPLIVRYPGKIAPKSIQETMVSSIDFYPTILEACQIDLATSVDGRSLWPLLTNSTPGLNRAMFWHYPHYHTPQRPPTGAVRFGNFKLLEFYEDARIELYDLSTDIGEKKDLSSVMPEKAAELRRLLLDWRKEVDADMPEENPDYNPEEPFEGAFPAWNGQNQIKE